MLEEIIKQKKKALAVAKNQTLKDILKKEIQQFEKIESIIAEKDFYNMNLEYEVAKMQRQITEKDKIIQLLSDSVVKKTDNEIRLIQKFIREKKRGKA